MKLNPKHWITLWREPWRKVFLDCVLYVSSRKWRSEAVGHFPTPDDVVFDIGGFEGNWAGDIQARFGCEVHVFEPHPDFASYD